MAEVGLGLLKVLHGTVGKFFGCSQLQRTWGLGRCIPKTRYLIAPHHHPSQGPQVTRATITPSGGA